MEKKLQKNKKFPTNWINIFHPLVKSFHRMYRLLLCHQFRLSRELIHPLNWNKQITPKQVHNLLVSLPYGKANGIDMIPNKMLKISAHVISSSLTDIFNCCTSMTIFQTISKLPKLYQFLRQAWKMILATTDLFACYLPLLGYLKRLHMINYIIISIQTIYWVNSSGALEKCSQQFQHYKALPTIGYQHGSEKNFWHC